MTKKKAQMVLKYKGLIMEMQCVWNVKTRVIPVTTGANETILKSFRKYLSNIHESTKSRNYKKTAILNMTHILLEILNVKL